MVCVSDGFWQGRSHIYFSMVVIMQNTQEKADLQKTKVNAMKIIKFRADGNKLCTGKNGGHKPSSLGSSSIVVASE